MANIIIRIDGKIAELPPNGLNLPLTYSIKERDGLNINTGSRSEYAFELPATKQNSDIFQRFFDVSGITINKQKFVDASIEVDGLPFFIGKAQLQSVTLSQDLYGWQGKTYKVAFYGNNADWALKIGDLLLKDLDYTDSLHTYDYLDNITAWNNAYPTYNYKYIVMKLKDWDTFGQIDGLKDSHPAYFIAAMVAQIFAKVGYTISSQFFNTDFFKRLVMPIPILSKYAGAQYGEDFLNVAVNETIIDPNGNYFPVIFTNQTVTPPNPPNPYNVAGFYSGFYLVPVTGYYIVRFTINVVSTSGVWGMQGGIIQNGVFGVYIGATYFNVAYGSTGNYTLSIESNVLYLPVGYYIGLRLTAGCDDPSTYFEISMEIVGEAEISAGFQVDFKYLIDRSWKAIDFIKGLAHAFNLVFETNTSTRVITIEPADRYLIESRPSTRQLNAGFYRKGRDYTQYVDLSKGGELVSDTKQMSQIRMRWKEDNNDPTVSALNLNENLGVLESRFVFPSQRYKEGEVINENPFFAATLVIFDNEIKTATSEKTPMIPFVWSTNYLETSSSSEIPTNLEPRILVSESVSTGYLDENGIINVFDGTSVIDYKTPLAYMVDYNDSTGYQTSLSFADTQIGSFSIAGLLKRFYLSELVRLQSGKYLDINILWDLVMIRNMSFRDKISINGDTYILQEVNSFDTAKKQSTKTYLKYDYKEPNAETQIENTIVPASINQQ